MYTYTISIKLPFGESFIADIEQEYYIDDGRITLADTSCSGIWAGNNFDGRLYFSFAANAGPECQFAESIAELCRKVWEGRIRDLCTQNAIDNKLAVRITGDMLEVAY
jgi:hypothetical protein